MLKMMAKGRRDDGRPVTLVFFGLSHANLKRLKAGALIKFNGETMHLGGDIEFVIFAGTDEREMGREVAKFIGPETDVNIDPRLKD
jgi:hypothetical protein